MFSRFFKREVFEPNFPIVPLYALEQDAQQVLSSYASVAREDPGNDSTIANYLLVAEDEETRIAVGIWDGRVRFTNYLTSQFDQTESQRGDKLRWFVDYYGGLDEFDEPADTGHMLWLRNPSRKILILFGLHLGPVRIIDEDESHWADDG
ncbi:MAG: hypothetical protein AAFY08_10725 [Planctomycetota bacterium]